MTEMLHVTQSNDYGLFKSYGKQMENRKPTCEILLERYDGKSELHCILTSNENMDLFSES